MRQKNWVKLCIWDGIISNISVWDGIFRNISVWDGIFRNISVWDGIFRNIQAGDIIKESGIGYRYAINLFSGRGATSLSALVYDI